MAPTLSTTGRPRNARTCVTALPAGRPTAWRPPRRGERLTTPINQKHAADHPLTAVAPPSEAVAVAAPTPAPTTADRSVWFKNWWAIAATDALDETRPNPLELMGDKLVAWKDAEGQWVVQADRCPHRSAPLSDGFVAKDRQAIVCSYHGYQFNGCGGELKSVFMSGGVTREQEDWPKPTLASNPISVHQNHGACQRPRRRKDGLLLPSFAPAHPARA